MFQDWEDPYGRGGVFVTRDVAHHEETINGERFTPQDPKYDFPDIDSSPFGGPTHAVHSRDVTRVTMTIPPRDYNPVLPYQLSPHCVVAADHPGANGKIVKREMLTLVSPNNNLDSEVLKLFPPAKGLLVQVNQVSIKP